MPRNLVILLAAFATVSASALPANAQQWNDEGARELVERATSRRARELADTALADYRATAHGYLTFLAQLGEGFPEPPKVIKADELALEVYWRAPNLSKQRIVGRRDTLLLPSDINYHRDHLGIVQNNFPDIIRLGEGDEVRDVPHPLSAIGLREYDFSLGDSITMRFADRTIRVAVVKVRPRDDRQARVIGALFIDRETAELVRMAFNFTHAAFIDRQLEDLAIVLENALVAGRYWLPRRQEIEIRRAGTWLDFPARGIIRGRWEICCHEVNVGLDAAFFRGPEIVVASPAVRASHPWTGAVLDSLPPDVRAIADADVRRVQEEARRLVRASALDRARRPALSARTISDLVRVNRVEGLALGAGLARVFPSGLRVSLGGRYGIDDRRIKGRVEVGYLRPNGVGVRAFAERAHRDLGDVPEVSLLRNSIAAQEFGSDYTDPYEVARPGLVIELGRRLGATWRIEAAYERHRGLQVNAAPARGRYEEPPWVPLLRGTRVAIAADRPAALGPWGTELRASAELRALILDEDRFQAIDGLASWKRAHAQLVVERPFGGHRLALRTTAAGAEGYGTGVPPEELVYLGGPVTGPGYDYHSLVAEIGLSQRIEWRSPVPFLPVPLGPYGRAPARATMAPFAHAVYLARPAGIGRRGGWYPSLGLGAILFFDALRVDVARGLRNGRWTFSADVTPELWRIL